MPDVFVAILLELEPAEMWRILCFHQKVTQQVWYASFKRKPPDWDTSLCKNRLFPYAGRRARPAFGGSLGEPEWVTGVAGSQQRGARSPSSALLPFLLGEGSPILK